MALHAFNILALLCLVLTLGNAEAQNQAPGPAPGFRYLVPRPPRATASISFSLGGLNASTSLMNKEMGEQKAINATSTIIARGMPGDTKKDAPIPSKTSSNLSAGAQRLLEDSSSVTARAITRIKGKETISASGAGFVGGIIAGAGKDRPVPLPDGSSSSQGKGTDNGKGQDHGKDRDDGTGRNGGKGKDESKDDGKGRDDGKARSYALTRRESMKY